MQTFTDWGFLVMKPTYLKKKVELNSGAEKFNL